MQTRLASLADGHEFEEPQIAQALHAGSEKAKQYVGKALFSDYLLLASGSHFWLLLKFVYLCRMPVLHPAIRLTFFETEDWELEVMQGACELLTETVRKYSAVTLTASTSSKPVKGIFAMAVKGSAETKNIASLFAGKDEVDMYIGGISLVEEGSDDPLGWWKVSFFAHIQDSTDFVP
jgi:hypothetical protein